ncbi:MAG: hypothetical protein BWX80_04186 [Candidatus Hydrogenedentes bacterium ADurb.Bin101]|nr:MAG: hypothetical protein BWX80_04186 [Candidatus Hydrogenedentes bacterium ADurb.Bin101]
MKLALQRFFLVDIEAADDKMTVRPDMGFGTRFGLVPGIQFFHVVRAVGKQGHGMHQQFTGPDPKIGAQVLAAGKAGLFQ